jgi:hypothetical protein
MLTTRHTKSEAWRGPLRQSQPHRAMAASASGRRRELPRLVCYIFWSSLLLVPGLVPFVSLHAQSETEPIHIIRIERNQDSIHLEWSGGLGPYQVQACSNLETGWFDLTGPTLEASIDFPAPDPFMLYRVRTEPDMTAPSAPASLAVRAAQCDRVALTWDFANDGALGTGVSTYNLYRDGAPILLVPASEHHVLDTGLLPGTLYQYSISATDRSGNESSRSLPVSFVTPDCVEADTNEAGASPVITLAWDSNEETDVAGYIIHWGIEPGVYPWAMDAMQSTSITISEVEPGVAYFFTVTAYSMIGIESEPSAEVVIIPPVTPDGAPAADR